MANIDSPTIGPSRKKRPAAVSPLVAAASRAAGPAAAPPPAPGAPPTPTPAYDPYDFSSDPLYQNAVGIYNKTTGEANDEALAALKKLAIDYGDPDFARSLGLDDATIAAAASNPFSAVAQEKLNAANKPRQLDEGLNTQNLYYGSARTQQQSDLTRSLLAAQHTDQENAGTGATAIKGNLAKSLLAAQGGLVSAGQDAAGRRQTQLGDLPVGGAGASTPGAPASPGAPRATAAASSPLVHAAAASVLPSTPIRKKKPSAASALAAHHAI
jgi:hypothetical protein